MAIKTKIVSTKVRKINWKRFNYCGSNVHKKTEATQSCAQSCSPTVIDYIALDCIFKQTLLFQEMLKTAHVAKIYTKNHTAEPYNYKPNPLPHVSKIIAILPKEQTAGFTTKYRLLNITQFRFIRINLNSCLINTRIEKISH